MTARRRGGVPPLVTVLITISAVVAAAIVAYFLFTTTSSAARTPMLEVTSAYALCSGTSCTAVHITLRNVGTSGVTISDAKLDAPGVNPLSCDKGSGSLPAGGSLNIKCSVSGDIKDGQSAALVLTVQPDGGSQQTLSIAFKIARP
jgi:hypothetical protein